ncbi:MAG: hypothetical protein ABT23_08120 [Thiobacillus sp. SCN 63-57]|uniref:hypothetical protein n=1 Tax=Thiobacillus sp. SCN 63-57 TaxID=1660145 RepID=UPI00086CCDAD|nr:hypothetical protein [Thiobacillus sp. SCN 63-57]ODV01556.1 MAG: hypothetical protein ABT23_08120 [Thiobacillus sp. SCN 63-57]
MRKALIGLFVLCAGTARAADMTVLRYVDQDPGGPPYVTRILVTPAFMRMDSGEDTGDFTLLDRKKRVVINIMRDSRLAMVFAPGALPPKPVGWKPGLVEDRVERGGRHFTLTVKGVVCSEGIAARHALDAARAMAEQKTILAATQYRVWKASPPELQHDCDLANQVWNAGDTLTLGLPLEEREFTGRTRTFESETRQPANPELFRVPEGLAQVNAPS